ncbi:hypothetical protein QE152_g3736 [Popillia japonica]|uniref:Endonuclease/exonuclease/phosphatase domain-containing protein n=1 Tax=Popillia japonica TaxID=7064 RepID=A0AAW1MYU1_POPJA
MVCDNVSDWLKSLNEDNAEVNVSQWEYQQCENLFNIQGFEKIVKLRPNGFEKIVKLRPNRAGGGVIIFYKTEIEVLEVCTDFSCAECLCVQLTIENKTFRILAIYRPPNLNARLFLEELEGFITNNLTKNAIILGDVNIDMTKENETAVNYENLMSGHGFIKKNLDHYIVAGAFRTNEAKQLNSALDHMETTFYQVNYEKFESLLQTNLSETVIRGFNNAEELYEHLVQVYRYAKQGASVSMTQRRRRNTAVKPWLTNQMILEIKERDKTYKIWKKSTEDDNTRAILRQRYMKMTILELF